MKPIVLSLVMGLMVAAGTARALDYDQTLKLVEAKIGEPTLLSLLAVDKPSFFPTTEQVKELRAAGATDAVIRVLIGQPNPAARPAAAPAAVPAPVKTPSAPKRVEEVADGQGSVQFENGDDRAFGVLINEANETIQLTAPNSALPGLPAGGAVRLPANRGNWTLSLFGGDYAAEVRIKNNGVTTIRLDPAGNGLRASVNDGERNRVFTLEADTSPAPAVASTPVMPAAPPVTSTNVVVQPPQTNTVYVQSQPSTVVVEQPTTYYYPSSSVVYGSPYYYGYPYRYYPYGGTSINLGFAWGSGSRYYGGYRGGYHGGGRPPPPPRGGHGGGRPGGGGPPRGGRR